MPTNAINDTGVKYLYDKLHDEIEGCINDDVETVIGNPLNFSTKFAQHAKSTKLTLEPIQDLHGYDKPWVGGAGKNKFNIDLVELTNCNVNGLTVSNKITDTRDTVAFQVQLFNDSTFVQLVVSQTINSNGKFAVGFTISSGTSYNKLRIKHNGTSQDVVICAMPFNKVGQFAISFNVTGYDPSVVGGMVFSNIQLEEGPQATSYEPYENLCPISGYDEIDLNEFGENLANVEFEQGAISSNIGLPYSGCKVSNNTRIRCENLIALNPNTDYILKLGNANYRYIIQTFDSQQLYYTESYSNQWTDTDTTFSGEPYIAIAVKKSDESDISVSEYVEADIKLIEQDSISNLSIDLPTTVYGGVLDLESGELVADWKIEDLGNYDWEYNSQYSVFISQSLVNHKVGDTNLISSDYETSESTSVANLRDYTIKGNGVYAATLYVKDPRYNDATIFKTAVNGVQICYELATPQIIQLTPHQLNLFKEQNNISSNATSISVTYKKGILTVIEPATESSDGIMSAADKQKLDLIADDATKTESSTTNGNIKINGTETQVYDDSEIKGELTTDTTTVEGNPLNFTTLSAQTAKSTILSVEPIQDLHGFDKPWVGGAGKNKLDTSDVTVDGISFNENSEYYISANPNNTDTRSWSYSASQYKFTLSAGSYKLVAEVKTVTAKSASRVRLYDSSETVLFDDGDALKSVGIKSYDFTLSASTNIGLIAKQYEAVARFMIIASNETTSYAPYKNECPISGRSEIGILGCGKNLLPLTLSKVKASNTDGTWNGNVYTYTDSTKITFSTLDGINVNEISLDFSSSPSSNNGNIKLTFTLQAGTYCLQSHFIEVSGVTDTYLQKNGVTIARGNDASPGRFFTLNETSEVTWTMRWFNRVNLLNVYPQIELDSTLTDFVPYTKSNDLTISLGQTVYGGTLDVENGVLVVTKVREDLGNLTWNYASKYGMYTEDIDSIVKKPASNIDYGNFITSCYPLKTWQDFFYPGGTDQNACAMNVQGALGISTTISDPTEFTTYITGQTICYELATPITINLTPHTINLLKGVNNISTDGDSITLTYRDGSVATLGDLTSAVDNLDSKIDESKILTDTATGDKYILVVTNGVLSVEQISN